MNNNLTLAIVFVLALLIVFTTSGCTLTKTIKNGSILISGENVSISINGKNGCEIETINGSGHMIKQSRKLAEFDKIENAGSSTLIVKINSKPSLSVEADDNILPHVKTDVSNGTLKIWTDTSFSSEHGVTVSIVNPALRGINLSGSGQCTLENLKENSLAISISGSGNVTATGTAQSLDADIAGSGDIEATDLAVDDASVDISGSGSARLCANESLNASISGSGSVRYRGDPNVTSNIAGSGSVNSM
ncbi:MAG: hypothetical protein C5B53_10950 [Candidatus Melainabacteria bacterium]|nr:MAG: hypothetical protein C5B53_10950 [Candidatus Melainabacteria bacterium]